MKEIKVYETGDVIRLKEHDLSHINPIISIIDRKYLPYWEEEFFEYEGRIISSDLKKESGKKINFYQSQIINDLPKEFLSPAEYRGFLLPYFKKDAGDRSYLYKMAEKGIMSLNYTELYLLYKELKEIGEL